MSEDFRWKQRKSNKISCAATSIINACVGGLSCCCCVTRDGTSTTVTHVYYIESIGTTVVVVEESAQSITADHHLVSACPPIIKDETETFDAHLHHHGLALDEPCPIK